MTAQTWFHNHDSCFRRKTPVTAAHSVVAQAVSLPGVSCCKGNLMFGAPSENSAGDNMGWVKLRTSNGLSKPVTSKAHFLISW